MPPRCSAPAARLSADSFVERIKPKCSVQKQFRYMSVLIPRNKGVCCEILRIFTQMLQSKGELLRGIESNATRHSPPIGPPAERKERTIR